MIIMINRLLSFLTILKGYLQIIYEANISSLDQSIFLQFRCNIKFCFFHEF